jgi:hypothetical protein
MPRARKGDQQVYQHQLAAATPTCKKRCIPICSEAAYLVAVTSSNNAKQASPGQFDAGLGRPLAGQL